MDSDEQVAVAKKCDLCGSEESIIRRASIQRGQAENFVVLEVSARIPGMTENGRVCLSCLLDSVKMWIQAYGSGM